MAHQGTSQSDNLTKSDITSESSHSRAALIGLGFFGVIIILAIATLFALVRIFLDYPVEPEQQSVIEIVKGGDEIDEKIYIPENELQTLSPRAQAILDQQRKKSLAAIERKIDAQLDRAFAPAFKQVASFADWFYSLRGEYTRYVAALANNAGSFLQDEFKERVFYSAQLPDRLAGSLEAVNQHIAGELQGTLESVKQEIINSVSKASIPWKPDGSTTIKIERTVEINEILPLQLTLTESDINKQILNFIAASGIGTLTAKGLGVVAAKNAAAKLAGTKAFQTAAALLAKVALKTSLKSGGLLGATLTGAAICSPGGLVAVACGAGAGIVTWFTVDKLFIEIDEIINRDEFERELRSAIRNAREELKAQLIQGYRQAIDQHYAQIMQAIDQGIKKPDSTFLPIDALRQKQDI